MGGQEELNKQILEDFESIKINEEVFKDIQRIGSEALENLISEKFKTEEEDEKEIKNKELLKEAYDNIIQLLKKYCDLNDDYYPIISAWIIGTYSHQHFPAYPYLFLNAMRGSGKSRTLKLITELSKEGEMQMSMTEAVLFRTNGTLGIDEFEGLSRKGSENLRELLNASYKKGTKVKRMKQKRTLDGVEQVVEEFNVYRPIVMANIFGMEEVLGDRCITLVIEKSDKPHIIKLAELWNEEKIFKRTKEILNQCSLCSVVALQKCYLLWNEWIMNNYITTHTTQTTYNNINYIQLFKRLNSVQLDGRTLELIMPLLLISWEIDEKVFEDLFFCIKNYISEKREDQFVESQDISFIDYISQEVETRLIPVKEVTKRFKEFLQYEERGEDDWLNPKWVGKALKRLKLKKHTKRASGGVRVILDIEKAKEKIKMFK